jgi:hypothetical protein
MLLRARRPDVRGGVLGLFRPDAITYTWGAAPPLPGDPERVPTALAFRAAGDFDAHSDSLVVEARLERVLATAPRPGEPPLVFLQARGTFDVRARIATVPISFRAPGSAEVFVPSTSR